MISLTPTGSPAETAAAHTLLEIIANPDLAKKHLDALMAEKLAATEAHENARKLAAEAKEKHATADTKLADVMKVIDEHDRNHVVRTKSLDERHEFLVAKDKRLTEYEATVTAREKELIEPLAAREKAADEREAALGEREASLLELEKAANDIKETHERKMAALKEALSG